MKKKQKQDEKITLKKTIRTVEKTFKFNDEVIITATSTRTPYLWVHQIASLGVGGLRQLSEYMKEVADEIENDDELSSS